MVQISSRLTFFNKRIFPAVWFGFVGLFFIAASIGMIVGQHPDPILLVIPAIMLVFGYFLMKALLFDLVDEVWDGGDVLIVRNRGIEEQIRLKDIINVSYSGFTNPPRITLTLRETTAFGNEFTFSPPTRLFPFTRHPIATDLIQRVDEARMRGG